MLFGSVHSLFHRPPASGTHVRAAHDVDGDSDSNVRIIASGNIHGVCFWWDCELDASDPTNKLDMAPSAVRSVGDAIDTALYTSNPALAACSAESCLASCDVVIGRSWRDHWMQVPIKRALNHALT
jgi:hypothetical protein